MSVNLEQRYQKSPSIVSRKVAGEMILVPIRSNVGDLESIYTLNDTGASAWELFDGQRSLGQVCEAIAAEYEVELEQAQRDLLELAEQLVSVQALEEV
ncbi:MAG: PqqD family protein [Anaerolineales bacterium]|nr:PqqD family protein [Anaerolineales bacterium]